MEKRWVLKPVADVDLVEQLSKELNINTILANLLAQRGVRTFQEAKHFFRPAIAYLHNPFFMRDMDKAIARISKAILTGEKMLIYGDYDVDGTSAVALVYSFFQSQYPNLGYYIPNRYSEGYGISTAGIDWAKANDYTLIIALDCGIKANDKVTYATTLGIDFIICDHHLPGEEIPAAVAVLDPKRLNCEYPFKELSGCGIGFKLIQAYAQHQGIAFSQLESYLDLVAVSIAADIVHITDENRVLTYFGLQWLNNNPRPGIKALIELSNSKKALTVSDIVFTIGPRINAAGRIEDGKQAVALLISANAEDATLVSQAINIQNNERRTLDTSITEQALELIAADPQYIDKKTTVLYQPDWHKGVIGIVASRLVDKYYRPTIVLTQSNDHVAGSARSVKDFDVYAAIESCSPLLEQFGGHKFAAGLTMKPENVEAFKIRFEEVVSASITEQMLTQEIEIEAEMELNQVTPAFYNVLKQFAPFGPGNMAPVFVARNVTDKGYARVVGQNHIKLSAMQASTIKNGGTSYKTFDAIGFQLGHHLPLITSKKPFDICFTIEENEWQGQVSLQLNVKDIKFSEGNAW